MSEIETAMPMLEKCRLRAAEMGHEEHHYSVRLDLNGDESCIYLLENIYMESRHAVYFTGVEDMPAAICEFALKLFGNNKTP